MWSRSLVHTVVEQSDLYFPNDAPRPAETAFQVFASSDAADQATDEFKTGKSGSNIARDENEKGYEEVGRLDLDIVKKSTAVKIFEIVVAIVAFMDFAAEMINQFSAFFLEKHGWNYAALEWLRKNGTNIGLLFSFFWFIDAFVVAHRKRIETCRRIDQKRLMRAKTIMDGAEVTGFCWHRAWGVYIVTVTLQVLLLPVGFYVFLYNLIARFDDNLTREAVTVVVRQQQRPASSNSTSMDIYERFIADLNASLMIAIVKHYVLKASNHSQLLMNKYYTSGMRSLYRYVIVNAFRRPRKLHREIRKTLNVIRWARYLAPLLGPLTSLFDKLSDLRKTCRQRILARLAQFDRERFRKDLAPDALRIHSATRIQALYRSYRARGYLYALSLLRGHHQKLLTLKLQLACRAWLRRARSRIAAKCAQLKALQEKRQTSGSKKLTVVERRNLYTLQQELQEKTSYVLNKMFLLRPDSTFIVAWRSILVVVVIIDIIQVALVTVLAQHKDPQTGDPLTLQAYLLYVFLPVPVGDLDSCRNFQYDGFPIEESGIGLLNAKLHARFATLVASMPWYCHPLYATWQRYSAALIALFIHRFYTIVACFLFLDVFVHFFTGDIDPRSGSVVPEKFIKRWIVPGIAIQLAVNPQMETTSKIIWSVTSAVVRRCPFRVLRWTAALFFPAALALDKMIKYGWSRLVIKQNEAVTPLQRKESMVRSRSHVFRKSIRLRTSVTSSDLQPLLLTGRPESIKRSSTVAVFPSDDATRALLTGSGLRHRRISSLMALSDFSALSETGLRHRRRSSLMALSDFNSIYG